MTHLVPMGLVLLGALALAATTGRDLTRRERQVAWSSLAAHMLSSVVMVWLNAYYYGYGDLIGYHQRGVILTELMAADFGRFFPEALALVLHGDVQLPMYVFGQGRSTGAMTGVSALLGLVFSNSIYAISAAVALFSFSGKLALYRALAPQFDSPLRLRVMFCALLVPSVVFWTSGLVKEALAVAGLGWLALGCVRFATGRPQVGVVMALFGATLVGLFKAYLLFAAVVSFGVWFYWRRAVHSAAGGAVRVRPAYLLLVSGVSVAGVVALGRLFPIYAVETLAERAAELQQIGARIEGGSNFQLSDKPMGGSAATQFVMVPLALASCLFRPLFFEVRNPVMAVNAVETTVVLWLVARVLVREGVSSAWLRIRSSAVLMLCLAFVASVGIAVGLATTNLGTLSRYRVPMFPFFFALVVALNRPDSAGRSARSPHSRAMPPGAAHRRAGRRASLRYRSSHKSTTASSE